MLTRRLRANPLKRPRTWLETAMISAPASSPGLIAAIHYRLKKRWGPALEANVKETRDKLLSLEEGRPDDSPHSFGDETYKVVVAKRHSRLPDEGLLLRLLADKKLAPENVFDQVVSQVLNETKLANLVALGKLTEKEVNVCRVELSTSVTVEKF